MDWLLWLENSGLAQSVRQFLYPFIQIVHIVGFVILVGTVTVFDLRLLGYSACFPAIGMAQSLLRLARLSFGFVVMSGFLLFSAQPTVLANNSAFRLKLLLLVAAGINALAFHKGPYRSVKKWNLDAAKVPPTAKASAILSLVLWAAIIACGRLIAYVA